MSNSRSNLFPRGEALAKFFRKDAEDNYEFNGTGPRSLKSLLFPKIAFKVLPKFEN